MNLIVQTADGSNTLYNEIIGEHYHSKHGALQESKHVFINAGLVYAAAAFADQQISILEIGFGTGLNFLLTTAYAKEHQLNLQYVGIEAFPLTSEALSSTKYDQYVSEDIWIALADNYLTAIKSGSQILPQVNLRIAHLKLQEFVTEDKFHLIYFDAFSVQHQPEMWSDDLIGYVCSFLLEGGIFVTYAITGKLKRALKSHGMTIEKLPGAPGKREMLRATKTNI